MDPMEQIIDILTDASGVTIDSKVIFDLSGEDISDIIKNSLIKEKLMRNPQILLKKSNTIYMFDNTVIDIKIGEEITFEYHSINSLSDKAD